MQMQPPKIDSMDEIWKDIPGYEGFYQVSSYGNVRSVTRYVNHSRGERAKKRGRAISIGLTPQGRPKVQLAKHGSVSTHSVHRLVCKAFHGPPPTKDHHVAHYNGIRTDNRPSNLRWATAKENEADKVRHGTKFDGHIPPEKRPRGERHGCAKLTRLQVDTLKKLYSRGIGSHQEIADLLGVSKTQIGTIIRGQSWSHTQESEAA